MPDIPKKKGHWPKGRRRHADRGDWSLIRLRLTELLDEYAWPNPGWISIHSLARTLRVDWHTVGHWLKGKNRPTPKMQNVIAAWLREQLQRIERQRLIYERIQGASVSPIL